MGLLEKVAMKMAMMAMANLAEFYSKCIVSEYVAGIIQSQGSFLGL